MDILKTKENPAVQAYINMLRGVINRMTYNSVNCKIWTITIITAILILYADDKVTKDSIWICYIPIYLFFFLDCLYLVLERSMIKLQSNFIAKINEGEDISTLVFSVKPEFSGNFCEKIEMLFRNFCKQLKHIVSAIFSFSTLPFYGAILIFIYYLGR